MAESKNDATQALPLPEWDDPQAQLLEDSWVLTLFAVLLATAVPWFVSSLNIDFAAASWAVLALGLCYLAMSLLAAERATSPWRRRRRDRPGLFVARLRRTAEPGVPAGVCAAGDRRERVVARPALPDGRALAAGGGR